MEKEEENRLGQEGVDKKPVILLRLIETQPVHFVPSPKTAFFHPSNGALEWMPYHFVEANNCIEKTLKTDRRKDCLIKRVVDKPLFIQAHQFLGQGGSGTRRRDDEDRL